MAQQGTLTRAQFEAMRRQALDLLDFLEPRAAAIGRALGRTVRPAEVDAAIAGLRARINAMAYEPRPAARPLLPQQVGGLTPTSQEAVWTYDPARPPRALGDLRASLVQRGQVVRDLPGGGWEASEAGRPVLLVLPAAPAVAAHLPPSLNAIAAGPQAQAGLAVVRSQTGASVPYLESQLLAAGGQNREATTRILRMLGRSIPADNVAAWRGLSNYLTLGGDVGALARSTAYGSHREFAAESNALARSVLQQAADWDASAVRGLAQVYQLRPQFTAERFHGLISNNTPIQVTGILQSLDFLAPRSRNLAAMLGPLSSDNVNVQHGAMGALTSAVRLAQANPNAIIAFEQPVSGPTGEIIRVVDVRVIQVEETRVAGVLRRTETILLDVEVKEITRASLAGRARQQFARDIARDSQLRASRPAPVGGSRPFFETMEWHIRRSELATEAARRLGVSEHDIRVDAEMRAIVESELRPALERSEVRALPAAEQQGYRNALRGVPFVRFF